MRPGFELKVSLFRIGAVVVSHRAFDVDGMGVVSLDKVAIVAVHGPHEIGERLGGGRGQAAVESGGGLRELKHEFIEARACGGVFRDHERLEQVHCLTTVGDRHLSCFLTAFLPAMGFTEKQTLSYVC